MDDLLRRSVRLTIILIAIICVILAGMRQWRFAAGLLVAACWSITNFFLIIKLLKIAVLQQSKAKLSAILLVKFPVLYSIGFFILTSKFFPVSSLLAGLVSVLLVMGAINIWPKRT